MRSQTYGDKQREAEQRKKQEKLKKQSEPEVPPIAETPKAEAEKTEQPGPTKTKRKATPKRL